VNWLRIRELVRKEFIELFRDKKNRPLLVIAPLLQLIIFGYVVTTDVRDIRVGIADQAHTSESRRLINAIDCNETFRITNYSEHPDELDLLLLQRKIDLSIILPPDFGSQIRKGKTSRIQIIADGSMSNMASVRISYIMTLLEQFNNRLIKELYPMRIDYGEIDGRIRTWYNPNLESRYYYVPGIVAFVVMLLSLLLTTMAIVREKEAGTMEQLIVTPLRPFELILGKTIPFIIISQAQMIMVIVFGILWFKIPMSGSVFILMIATCIFLLSTLGIGLFISTVSRTQQQAMMTNFFFILPFFMLSGFIFPVSNMPVVVQWLAYLNPLMHFLIIVRGVFLKGTGISVLWPQFIWLGILGGAVFAGSVNRFKKRLD
jgi:ABC-2 type transport system permease protein